MKVWISWRCFRKGWRAGGYRDRWERGIRFQVIYIWKPSTVDPLSWVSIERYDEETAVISLRVDVLIVRKGNTNIIRLIERKGGEYSDILRSTARIVSIIEVYKSCGRELSKVFDWTPPWTDPYAAVQTKANLSHLSLRLNKRLVNASSANRLIRS